MNYPKLEVLLKSKPQAMAKIKGSLIYPEIVGEAWFYQTPYGVLVMADVEGLPKQVDECRNPIFAFHIHKGRSCTGNYEDLFADAGMHYNPKNCPHPYHAGDLPPLFGANGNAFMAVLSNRFDVEEVIGRTIIIHSQVDDFTTQPSGNAGIKMACGVIEKFEKD